MVLLDTEEGVLLSQRKKIVDFVIEILPDENPSAASRQKRVVSGNALVDVMGKFKTFSSG